MEDLQNEANPFIMISQAQAEIWAKTLQNIFNHMLGLMIILETIRSQGKAHKWEKVKVK